ncbi:MAG: nickel-dependent lactate racemase [Chloroflexi bacterium]|nr:nickel-dependent lactate racemase [Chloroflexota bacterium]
MAEFHLPYGKTTVSLSLPDDRHVEVIAPRDAVAAPDLDALVRLALDKPAGEVRLEDFSAARSAAVVISDKTRPIPHGALYPLLERLESIGLAPDAITLLLATGTHAPMLPEEFGKVLPDDLLARYPVISHDCDDADLLVDLGVTERGTPVLANRHFVEADVRIVVGNIEPHQFMGFSGGVKSAAVGLAGRDTINRNHAMLLLAEARIGAYETNPARQDVEEIGHMMGVHFALNAVLNRHKQIVHVVAGEPLAVMQAGIPLAREICEVPVSAPFDLVFTSPGGHPKDINLYQAQKALAHAALVTKDGGAVVLVAACPEGTGSAKYERWMTGKMSYQQVLDRFAAEEFCLGPHKAYQIARDAARVWTLLLSEMLPEQVRGLLLTPVARLDTAIQPVLRDLPPDARIGVMPAANATVPVLAQ